MKRHRLKARYEKKLQINRVKEVREKCLVKICFFTVSRKNKISSYVKFQLLNMYYLHEIMVFNVLKTSILFFCTLCNDFHLFTYFYQRL